MELNENNYQEFVEKIVGGMDDDERKHLQFITTNLSRATARTVRSAQS